MDDIRKMSRRLQHRGPDEEGFYEGPGCAIGHRRLSIIDLAGGHQPLSTHDGRIHAAVNGEIYNFIQLRRELMALGHRFSTRSDSEVVLHGFAEWGEEMVPRLEGMFALAVWDSRRRSLLLARDRMGQKPLYYADFDGGLVFASEVKAILTLPGFERRVDPTALGIYLATECVPEHLCIFEGVRKVKPGELLTWQAPLDAPRDVAIRRRTYWSLRFQNASDARWAERPEEELVDELERRVLVAVEDRLVSDVPLGVFLSGGLDSSLVTAAMARLMPARDVKTFSIGFTESSFDERHHAARVAQHLGTTHHLEVLEPRRMLDRLHSIFELLDEPLGDASIVPTDLLSSFARQHVKVALGGDGGDELFFGYPTFTAERVARLLDHLSETPARRLRRVVETSAAWLPVSRRYFSLDFKLKRFATGIGLAPAERHQRWLSSFSREELKRMLGRDVSADLDTLLEPYRNWPTARDDDDRLLAQYAHLYLAGDVLVKVDRASMAHGLEVRSPLLDRRIVELACALPTSVRFRRATPKYLLKRLGQRWLPASVVHRKKQGFAVPVADWLRGPLRGWGEELLDCTRLAGQGLLDPGPVAKLWSEHQEGRADHRKPLWTLLVFQLWYERYGR